MEWVGLANYSDLLRDSATWAALGHTLYYIAGYLPLVLVGGLALAVALNTAGGWSGRLPRGLLLPVVTSWVVVALVWKWLLNPGERSGQPGASVPSGSTAPAGGPTRPGRCRP